MFFLCLLLAVSQGFAAKKWYVGEWKTKPENGQQIGVRFGSNGKGVLSIHQNSKPISLVNIKWKKVGNQLIATRNGVDMKFKLKRKSKTILTGGGVKMVSTRYRPLRKKGCAEACWAVNAGEKNLKDYYGRSTVPKRFRYAQKFYDNQGAAALKKCSAPHGFKAFTDPLISDRCRIVSDKACIAACKKSKR